MLSYGRLVGQLSRITRHATKNTSEPFKHVGFVSITCQRYSSKNKKTRPTGATAKVEECVPPKGKLKKLPPVPPPPPPPPPHASAPPAPPPGEKPPERVRAPCDNKTYSCPPNCPPAYTEDCFKPGGPPNKPPEFKYWKHLIAALILAGVSVYAYIEYFMGEKEEEVLNKQAKKKGIEKNPPSSGSIPQVVQYLLIGGGTASFSAFRAIKSLDPKAKILIITEEGDIPYMRPPLSKELWYQRGGEPLDAKLMFRQWNGAKRSVFYEPLEFYTPIEELAACENGGVSVASGYRVEKIDVIKKIAYLDDGYQIVYDRVLIATGATSKNLEIFEKANEKIKDKVLAFRTKQDFLDLTENLQNPKVKNIVIIGGGLLGSELASSIARNLKHESQKVIQIFKEKYILAQILPEYLSEWVTKHVKSQGVECISELEVHDCKLQNNDLYLTLTDAGQIKADQVLVAIGVKPNTSMGKESKLEVDPEHGGLLVNAEFEARTDVWVAGDAACFYDDQLGRRRVEHHDHAVLTGRLAGENMTGAAKPYVHQSMFWSDLGPEVGFEAIGIVDSSLQTVGVFAKATVEDDPSAAITDLEEADNNESKKETKSSSESKLSSTDNSVESSQENSENESESTQNDDFGKGIIFYLRDNIVVGIVLWNIYGRMSIAKRMLARGTTYDEINEAAKLFAIHDESLDN